MKEFRLPPIIENNRRRVFETASKIYQFLIHPSLLIRKTEPKIVPTIPSQPIQHDEVLDPETHRDLLRWGDEGGASGI